MHPAIQNVLRFFEYGHLPPHLQEVSRPFCELAKVTAERAPDNQETTVALRKLLEAKDAAVRATLPTEKVAEAAKRGAKGLKEPE